MTIKRCNYSALYPRYERVVEKINLLLKLGFKLSDERGFEAKDVITGHNSSGFMFFYVLQFIKKSSVLNENAHVFLYTTKRPLLLHSSR